MAEQDGDRRRLRVVAVELSGVHAGLARPDGAALLGWAATLPEVRASAPGVALTRGTFAWARERGHETIVTDWRVTNLLAPASGRAGFPARRSSGSTATSP